MGIGVVVRGSACAPVRKASHRSPGPPGAAGAADETAGAAAAGAALAAGAPEADGEATAAAVGGAAACALNPNVAVPAAGTCAELAALVGRPKLNAEPPAEAVAAAG